VFQISVKMDLWIVAEEKWNHEVLAFEFVKSPARTLRKFMLSGEQESQTLRVSLRVLIEKEPSAVLAPF
jgi:CII-binding regulator of phage lambda lysogenization HflD